MEVEHEHALAALDDNHLVLVALQRRVLVIRAQVLEPRRDVVHRGVERVHVLVPQVVHVHQVEAAAAQQVGVAVAGHEFAGGRLHAVAAREVDPFGVAELVPHEVQVPLAAEAARELADHLVQRDAAAHHRVVRRQRGHVVVHLLVHQPKRGGLVTHQRLVVRLGVRDALLAPAAVLQAVHQVEHVPVVVVAPLGEHLDPLVRDGHLQAVVEADAALGDGARERGHAGDVLRDGDAVPVVQRV